MLANDFESSTFHILHSPNLTYSKIFIDCASWSSQFGFAKLIRDLKTSTKIRINLGHHGFWAIWAMLAMVVCCLELATMF
jgi:hypothetical protein